MNRDERMAIYLNSLEAGNAPFLEELEREARQNRVPIIRRETQSLLKVLLAIRQPKRILEVGTAVGFSAILMAAATSGDCQITTIENYEKRIPKARKNFRESGYEERITLLEGDAAEVLKTLDPPFDFVFMDAAKGQYLAFLPEVLRLMRPGSLLVSDNVLQNGDLLESHYLVERRNRTIYKRMREYLYQLKHREDLVTTILSQGDGVAISVMQEKAITKE